MNRFAESTRAAAKLPFEAREVVAVKREEQVGAGHRSKASTIVLRLMRKTPLTIADLAGDFHARLSAPCPRSRD
jgi:hypothetical protein